MKKCVCFLCVKVSVATTLILITVVTSNNHCNCFECPIVYALNWQKRKHVITANFNKLWISELRFCSYSIFIPIFALASCKNCIIFLINNKLNEQTEQNYFVNFLVKSIDKLHLCQCIF